MIDSVKQAFTDKTERQRPRDHQHQDRGGTDRGPDRHGEGDEDHESQDRDIEIPAQLDGLGFKLLPEHASSPQSKSLSPS